MKKTIMSFLFSVLLIFSVGMTVSADPPQDRDVTVSETMELEATADVGLFSSTMETVYESTSEIAMDSFISDAEPAVNSEILKVTSLDNYLNNVASINSNQLEPRYGYIPAGKMQCYYVKLE